MQLVSEKGGQLYITQFACDRKLSRSECLVVHAFGYAYPSEVPLRSLPDLERRFRIPVGTLRPGLISMMRRRAVVMTDLANGLAVLRIENIDKPMSRKAVRFIDQIEEWRNLPSGNYKIILGDPTFMPEPDWPIPPKDDE